jgi:hypothetical protein
MKRSWTSRALLLLVSVFVLFSTAGCNAAVVVADLFSEGLLAVQKDGHYGYINEKGKKIIEFYYDQAYAFQDGVALVKVGTKWNLIDKQGDKVFEDDYVYLERDPETDLLWFVENDQLGLMNKNGKVLAEPIYDVDKNIASTTYYNYSNFSEGLARVSNGTKYGYINTKGNVEIEVKFDEAGYFHEGLAYIRSGTKWGYIDKTGDVVIAATYDDAFSFNEHGLALVEVGDLYKVINKKNQIILDSYDDINDVGDFFVVKDGTDVFFVDLKGERVDTVNYEDGGPFTGGYFGFANYSPDELYVYNARGKQVFVITNQTDMDDSADFFVFGGAFWVLFVREDGLELDNGKAADTMAFDGDDIIEVYNKLVVVRDAGKTGVVNFKDEHIVEFLYDSIDLFGDDYMLVRLGTFYGILNSKGDTIVEPDRYTACQTALNP